ncbi:MAG: glutathione S-transferase [Myxococcota bacterium]
MPEVHDAPLVLYYAPRTRSFTALWILEELEVPYRLESFAIRSGRHRQDDFLALNPMGKVPVVVDGETPVAELGALAIYLADRYRERVQLSPPTDAPERAAFLRWCFFASAIMEPAYGEKLFGWEAPPPGSVAWGSFERTMGALAAGLSPGPQLLGETFSVADALVASNLRFGMLFGALAKDEEPFARYVGRMTTRPAFLRARAIETREGERFPPGA